MNLCIKINRWNIEYDDKCSYENVIKSPPNTKGGSWLHNGKNLTFLLSNIMDLLES